MYVNRVNNYIDHRRNHSTNYIIKTLFDKELHYFTVRDQAGILNIPVRNAYTHIPVLEDKGFISSI